MPCDNISLTGATKRNFTVKNNIKELSFMFHTTFTKKKKKFF